MKTTFARRTVLATAFVASAGLAQAQSGDVNVYTYRESKLIQPLFDAITKDTGIKVTTQVQDEQVRVTGKKRDDLQAVIAALRGAAVGLPLQFTNFRD